MLGRTLKHYEVQESLGRGGMGEVYKAKDARLGRTLAIKVLPKEFTSDKDRRERFLREARAASAVNHPAIAQVYDVDEVEGDVFIAMELVEGRTVRRLLQDRELDLLGSLEIAAQVASGLAKAHEAGIVHRDIKPENVMVTPDGHAKILDFGLAKLVDSPSDVTPAPNADELSVMETVARTQAGMVLGTLRYMSPEQARGKRVDQRSDIFSLGIVIYEMVTGRLPFSGESAIDTLHAIAFEETRPITALRANLPSHLQRVVTRCLRKRPEDRYASAKELFGELKTVQREVESGVSAKVPLPDLLRERLQALKEMTPGEWTLPITVAVVLLALLVLMVLFSGDWIPGTIFFGIVGLFIYRRIRNRSRRLLKRFSGKVQKLEEIRLIVVEGQEVTVVADRALAKTYVRVNAAMDAVNSKMFFGDPFTVTVKDQLSSDEERALLSGSGVVFVRDDVLEAPALSASTSDTDRQPKVG